MATRPLALEQFRAAVTNRYRPTPRPISEGELLRTLEEGAFRQFQFMNEYMEQFRLIAAKLAENGTQEELDLAAQMANMTNDVFSLFQNAIIDLPHATLQ